MLNNWLDCRLFFATCLVFVCWCSRLLTVWQKTTSRRYCTLRSMAMVGARSCISRNTIDFFALSLIIATHSVSVVSRGYSASLHSPDTCMITQTNQLQTSIIHYEAVISSQYVTYWLNFYCYRTTWKTDNTTDSTGKLWEPPPLS